MKSYNTISTEKIIKLVDYEEPKQEIGPYIVDDSNFVPISEAIKQLSPTFLSDLEIESYYDFANGKDTGIKVPITRTHDGKDIAEISTNIMEQVNNIADKKLKADKKISEQQAFEQQLNTINKTLSTPTD